MTLKTWRVVMTSSQARCGASEVSWHCCRGLMKFFELWFDIRRMISILYWRFAMKLSKQVLVLLLCFSLVRFTAQAESYSPTCQRNDHHRPSPGQPSPQ